MQNKHKKLLLSSLMLFMTFLALVEPSFAQDFGKVQTALDKIVELMTGTIARSIAIIAVAGVGIGWIAGYIEMRKAFFVVVGIGIIFGATQIVDMLKG